MKKILISIISDQTIPNLLLILEQEEQIDKHIFLTTKAMEQKGKSMALLNAAQLNSSDIDKVWVLEDQINSIKDTLDEKVQHNKGNVQFIVNITGGTKPMSLAVYDYFKGLDSRFFYLPIGKKLFIEYDSDFRQQSLIIKTRLNLNQYLAAGGISYSIKENFVFTKFQCREIYKLYRRQKFLFADFPVKEAQLMAGLPQREENIRGTWFEEFIYYQIKQQLKLTNEAIATSVMIYKDQKIPYNDNEFDVMFVRDNALFVIECKVHLSGGNQKSKLDASLHKLGAISKNFGLRTHSYIFTLSDLHNKWGTLNKRLLRRCEVLNVKPPVDVKSFENTINMNEIFKI